MRVRFWGVRGSLPVSGPGTVRYGGNTSCVEVRAGDELVVVDGGTGLRLFGQSLTHPVKMRMVFSHLHWDHIQGFPFFGPIYMKESSIDIYSGHKADVSLVTVLEGQMQEPNFPVNLGGLPARMTFNEIEPGASVQFGELTMKTIGLNHPSGAMGVRFEYAGAVYVHLTDHEHAPDWEDGIISFCDGADVLSMDTMFAPEDYARHKGWGHSTWKDAVSIAGKAGVKKVVLFHHNPDYDDDRIDELAALASKEFPDLEVAREGMILEF